LVNEADRFQQKDEAALSKALAFYRSSLVGFHTSASMCWMLTSSRRSKGSSSDKLTDFTIKIRQLVESTGLL